MWDLGIAGLGILGAIGSATAPQTQGASPGAGIGTGVVIAVAGVASAIYGHASVTSCQQAWSQKREYEVRAQKEAEEARLKAVAAAAKAREEREAAAARERVEIEALARARAEQEAKAAADLAEQEAKAEEKRASVAPVLNPPRGVEPIDDPSWRSAKGYQQTRWGMSRAEVRKVAPGTSSAGKSTLAQTNLSVSGFKAKVLYTFVDNRLTSVIVAFDVASTKADSTYSRLRSLLEQKYGEPIYAPDVDLHSSAGWLSDDTVIGLIKPFAANPAPVALLYRSADIGSLEDRPAIDDKTALEDL